MLFQINFYKAYKLHRRLRVTVLQVFYSTLEKQQIVEDAKYEVSLEK